jgi:hypothetical protein
MIMFEILTRMAPFEMDQDLLTAKRKLYTMYIVLPFCMYQSEHWMLIGEKIQFIDMVLYQSSLA